VAGWILLALGKYPFQWSKQESNKKKRIKLRDTYYNQTAFCLKHKSHRYVEY
jgi:hypothetical protein